MTTCLFILASADPMQHVLPHVLFRLGPFPFTNHSLMLVITAAIMLISFSLLTRNYPMVPTGLRNLFETSLVFVRDGVARPVLHEHTDRFLPFAWTLFFFILINNLLGMIPLSTFSGLTVGNTHLFGTATANISVTSSLALIAFLATHVSGVTQQYRNGRHLGYSAGAAFLLAPVMHIYKMVPHVPGILGILMFPVFVVLEVIIAPLVRPFALAMRLFANLMGGHMLLAALLLMLPAVNGIANGGLALVGILACTAVNCLELLVAFLQAYIFVFLTCMFIGSAVNPEH